jgi:hypothetical protein
MVKAKLLWIMTLFLGVNAVFSSAEGEDEEGNKLCLSVKESLIIEATASFIEGIKKELQPKMERIYKDNHYNDITSIGSEKKNNFLLFNIEAIGNKKNDSMKIKIDLNDLFGESIKGKISGSNQDILTCLWATKDELPVYRNLGSQEPLVQLGSRTFVKSYKLDSHKEIIVVPENLKTIKNQYESQIYNGPKKSGKRQKIEEAPNKSNKISTVEDI